MMEFNYVGLLKMWNKILMILEGNMILYFFCCFLFKLERLLVIKTTHLIASANNIMTVSVSYLTF